MEIYIYEGNVQKGPFELQQIHTLAASGLISKEALYWQPGMDGWKPLAALQVFMPPPPRPETQKIDVNADAARIYKIAYSQRRFLKSVLISAVFFPIGMLLEISLVGFHAPEGIQTSISIWLIDIISILCLAVGGIYFYFLIWYFIRLRFLLYNPFVAIGIIFGCVAIPFFLIGEMIFTHFQIQKAYDLEGVSHNSFGFPSSETLQQIKPQT